MNNLIRLSGVTLLLICLTTSLWSVNKNAFDKSNVIDVINRHGELGIITIGAALLIVVGGIDLSIGSVVGLAAIMFGVLMEKGFHPYTALCLVLLSGPVIGLIHGLLVTRLKLQSFLVTLCGMFIYRGITRRLTEKNTGLVQVRNLHPDFSNAIDQLRYFLVGKDAEGALVFPMMLLVMLIIAIVLGFILHKTAYGRYWYAIGYNERAAEFAGVNANWQKCIVFMICSTLAVLAGVMLLLNSGTADPSNAGNSLELYAITAAVLGGCSLRGGEGLMIGFVLGALVQPVINNLMVFADIRDSNVPWVMGSILLFGTIADEMIRRWSRRKK